MATSDDEAVREERERIESLIADLRLDVARSRAMRARHRLEAEEARWLMARALERLRGAGA